MRIHNTAHTSISFVKEKLRLSPQEKGRRRGNVFKGFPFILIINKSNNKFCSNVSCFTKCGWIASSDFILISMNPMCIVADASCFWTTTRYNAVTLSWLPYPVNNKENLKMNDPYVQPVAVFRVFVLGGIFLQNCTLEIGSFASSFLTCTFIWLTCIYHSFSLLGEYEYTCPFQQINTVYVGRYT